MKKIADSITYFRFFLGILMLYFASISQIYMLSIAYILNVILDILDGYAARKLHQATDFGKRLDIIADNFIVVCLIAGFYMIKRDMLIKYSWHILYLVGYFLIVQLLSIALKKKFIFMRTFAANLAAIIFPFLIMAALFMELRALSFIYAILMLYSLTEKLLISLEGKAAKTIFLAGKKHLACFFIIFPLLALLLFFIPVKDNLVCFGDNHCIIADIRDTEEGRAAGLMFREALGEKEGMLFIFSENVEYPFWMKNMKIPIDIIFISKDKKIVSISKNAVPCNKPDNECELYKPDAPYYYVVETAAGFADRHNLDAGSSVFFDR